MNHKTWSRDGHKCMTGKVSADPGRPCVFPFYATTDNNGSLEWNCIVPDTYNKAIMNTYTWQIITLAGRSPGAQLAPTRQFSGDRLAVGDVVLIAMERI